MNVTYDNLLRKTKRIIEELKEMEGQLNEALARPDHKHGLKLAKLRRRSKDALLHLTDAVQ